MRSRPVPLPSRHVSRAFAAAVLVAALAAPAAAHAAPKPSRPPLSALGTLAQLPGTSGCLVARVHRTRGCAPTRALRGPAPFLGSHALAISPDGRNLYVASSLSNAIAVFRRNPRTGVLTQPRGPAGCIAAQGAEGCATGAALEGPNSVAVSADGTSVYATSLRSNAVVNLRRDPATGALAQAGDGGGCVANVATTGCTTGRALDGPDVVTVSPDGRNVYVGAFLGNAVAVFARDAASGALTQPADATGCLVNAPADGCTIGLALGSPEGLAISADGATVYVAAATGNALDVLARDPATGALNQAMDGSGCIAAVATTGCTTGTQLSGANAVAISPDDGDVYVTSLLSNSLTSFTRASTGQLTQQTGTSACAIYVLAVGCSLVRAFSAPEGLAVSPDGASVYAAAFRTGAIDVFDRNTTTGAVMQKPRRAGCVVTSATPDCGLGRGIRGASSIVVSPDGRFVYAAGFASDAVAVFKRITRSMTRG